MWFLAKCAFWLTLVVAFIPVPENERRPGAAYVSTGEAVSALSAALADARGFCARNPDACATTSSAVQGLGQKAQIGARMLQDFFASDRRELPAQPAAAQAPAAAGRDTLEPRDREPGWRAPAEQVAQARRI
jgi:ABC-type nitrate/sulfonate/bicarbonate transport system substrate-binding protein